MSVCAAVPVTVEGGSVTLTPQRGHHRHVMVTRAQLRPITLMDIKRKQFCYAYPCDRRTLLVLSLPGLLGPQEGHRVLQLLQPGRQLHLLPDGGQQLLCADLRLGPGRLQTPPRRLRLLVRPFLNLVPGHHNLPVNCMTRIIPPVASHNQTCESPYRVFRLPILQTER